MNIFEKIFGIKKTENTKTRKLSDLDKGIPEYVVYYQQAIGSYNSQNYKVALDNINKTIEKSDIDDWKYFAFKANVLEDLGKYQDAIESYTKAIYFAGDNIRVYALFHQIGFCYLSLGNNHKAIEFYSYAINYKKQHPNNSLNPDFEGMDMGVILGIEFKKMYNNRANALKNIGKLQEALVDCKKSLEYDQKYSNPYLLLSQIYAKVGQEKEALKYLQISASLGNTNAKRVLSLLRH